MAVTRGGGAQLKCELRLSLNLFPVQKKLLYTLETSLKKMTP